MSARELVKVEGLAIAVHGKASAVSVDKEAGGVAVRVWDAKGNLRAQVWTAGTRTEALKDMRAHLEEELRA